LQALAIDEAWQSLPAKLPGILRQTDRLQRLIDNLLDVSRLASGQVELEVEAFDFAELVSDVVAQFNQGIASGPRLVELVRDEHAYGFWDRMRVEQVVVNLLSNAVRYGRGQPVRVGLSGAPEEVVLTVEDRGVGIAQADLERIFERFERVGGRCTPGGLGLGLYISRRIVESLGGRIQAESKLGEGSRFTLILPRRTTASREQPQLGVA
jgi:signal transduction histidine kinase